MQIVSTKHTKRAAALSRIIRSVFEDHVFENSAALAYYFLFSICPFLLLVGSALSSLKIEIPEKWQSFSGIRIIPAPIANFLFSFISGVGAGEKKGFFLLGIGLTLVSLSRILRTLKRMIRMAYRYPAEKGSLSTWLFSVFFAVLFLVAMYASLILLVAGNRILRSLAANLNFDGSLLLSLQALRIFFLISFLFLLLLGIYYLLPGIRMRLSDVLPGTIFALAGWLLSSFGFSYYVDNITDYSALYGSLGAMIVLMTWLFLINFCILAGAYLNARLYFDKFGEEA